MLGRGADPGPRRRRSSSPPGRSRCGPAGSPSSWSARHPASGASSSARCSTGRSGGHLVHADRGDPRLRHRDGPRVARRARALVLGVRRAARRAVHRRHQLGAEDRAGADHHPVVRHRLRLEGGARGLADRAGGADCRLSGGADADPDLQALLASMGATKNRIFRRRDRALDAAGDHRDVPDQYRLRARRRGRRRVHLVPARARSPDLHGLLASTTSTRSGSACSC